MGFQVRLNNCLKALACLEIGLSTPSNMRRICFCLAACFLLLQVHAQSIIHRNEEIEKMVSQVSSDSLKSDVARLVSFGTRHTMSRPGAVRGIEAARLWIYSRFLEYCRLSGGRMTATIDRWTLPGDPKNRLDTTTEMGNVMAILHGTDTSDKRIFIVSGHMDSRVTNVMNRESDAPGANDDGSGTAAVMECARILCRHSFPATIVFVTYCGEEQGLLGSQHLAEKAKQDNWTVEAVLNNDIMGSNNSSETKIIDNTRVRVFSEGLPFPDLDKAASHIRSSGLENDGSSRTLARYIKETGERYVDQLEVVLIYRADRVLRGGDQIPFQQKGFPAVRITEMNENFYHQHQDIRQEAGIAYGDLPEFMDFEYLRKNTALNLSCLANLASSPSRPQDVKIELSGVANGTSLHWKAPASGKAKGYFVLMRETSQPMWEKKFFTESTDIRLPYSKDNYFFAVQSVSENGNDGLPVVPVEAR
jgi:hypothetical protein